MIVLISKEWLQPGMYWHSAVVALSNDELFSKLDWFSLKLHYMHMKAMLSVVQCCCLSKCTQFVSEIGTGHT
jgi:hypothetical protein